MLEKCEMKKVFQKMKSPYVKHKVSADVAVYADRHEKDPIASMHMHDEQSYAVWCVIKLVSTIILVSWSLCKVKQLLDKIL